MSEILMIKPPASWEKGIVGGDEQMFYRLSGGVVEARTVELEWRESAMSYSCADLDEVKAFYIDEHDPEADRWQFEWMTGDELDAFLRAG